MKRDWLEDKLRDKLSEDASPEIDMDKMWNDIESKRYPHKDKSWLLWLALFLLSIISIGAGTYTWNAFNTKSSAQNLPVPSPKNLNKQKLEKSKTIPIDNKTNNSAIKQHDIVEETAVFDKAIQKKEAYTSYQNLNQSTPSTKHLNNKSGNQNNENISATYITEIDGTYSSDKRKSNLNPIYANRKAKETSIIKNQSLYFDVIASTNPNLKYPRREPLDCNLSLKAMLPYKSTSHSHWQLGLIGSYNISNGTLITDYQEQHLDAFQLGFQLGKNISDRIFFTSGLDYTQHTKRFTSFSKTERQEEREMLLEIINKKDGTVENIRGQGTVKITETNTTRTYLRFRSITAPLYMGYTIPLNEQLQLKLSGGVHIGYSLKNEGVIYTGTNGSTPLYLNERGYQNQFYLGHGYNVEIQKSLPNQFYLNIGLNANWDIMSRNSLENSSDKFVRYGMHLGIGKSL